MIDIRRLLVISVCLFVMLSLCACCAEQTFSPETIRKVVSFDSGGITIKGTLDYAAGKESTFTVTEPENISGTVFTDKEISYGDIKIGYGKTKNDSPVSILLTAVSDLVKRDIQIPVKGEYSYDEAFSSAGYRIIFDCEKSEIKSIETEKFIFNFE